MIRSFCFFRKWGKKGGKNKRKKEGIIFLTLNTPNAILQVPLEYVVKECIYSSRRPDLHDIPCPT